MGDGSGLDREGPGFARAGLEGTIARIDADSLTVTTADGVARSVVIDGETRFVSEEEIDPATLDVGDEVRVQPESGGFPGNPGGQATDGETVASQVTLLAPGAP